MCTNGLSASEMTKVLHWAIKHEKVMTFHALQLRVQALEDCHSMVRAYPFQDVQYRCGNPQVSCLWL